MIFKQRGNEKYVARYNWLFFWRKKKFVKGVTNNLRLYGAIETVHIKISSIVIWL